jgi:hypothetical protein
MGFELQSKQEFVHKELAKRTRSIHGTRSYNGFYQIQKLESGQLPERLLRA